MLNEMIVSFNPFSWCTLILMFDINSCNPCSLRPLITFESNFMKSLRRCHYWCLQQNDSLSFRRIKFISLNSFILPFVLSLDLFERRTRFLFCSKPFKTRVGGKEHYHVLPSSHERVVLVFLRLNLFRKRMNEQGVNFCISATLFFLGKKFFSLRYVTPVLEVKQNESRRCHFFDDPDDTRDQMSCVVWFDYIWEDIFVSWHVWHDDVTVGRQDWVREQHSSGK